MLICSVELRETTASLMTLWFCPEGPPPQLPPTYSCVFHFEFGAIDWCCIKAEVIVVNHLASLKPIVPLSDEWLKQTPVSIGLRLERTFLYCPRTLVWFNKCHITSIPSIQCEVHICPGYKSPPGSLRNHFPHKEQPWPLTASHNACWNCLLNLSYSDQLKVIGALVRWAAAGPVAKSQIYAADK